MKKCHMDCFLLQTNLCISLHDQSDVLQHNGTNYEQLLFSSELVHLPWVYVCSSICDTDLV